MHFKTKATEYGCMHEKDAIESYKSKVKENHTQFQFQRVGLVINPKYPHFGASPDGFVTCDCCGQGCLEVKCPYCIKDSSVEEQASKVFCLDSSTKYSVKYLLQILSTVTLLYGQVRVIPI